MNAAIRIALKDLLLLRRDTMALFWVLAFPLLFAIFFGSIFRQGGSTAKMTIAVVDEDRSDFSKEFIANLGRKPSVQLWLASAADGGTTVPLTRNGSLDLVRRGRATAALFLNPGLGEFPAMLDAEKKAMEVAVDPARAAESGFIDGLLIQSTFETLQGVFLDREGVQGMVREQLGKIASAEELSISQKMVFSAFLGSLDGFLGSVDEGLYASALGGGKPAGEGKTAAATGGGLSFSVSRIDINRDDTGKPRSSWDITFPQAMLWAVFGALTTFSLMLVAERREGTMVRLRVAPLAGWEILGGKALGAFIAVVASMTLLFLIGKFAFGVRLANAMHMTFAISSIAFCFVGVILFVSTLGDSEAAVSGAGVALFIIWAMIGGGMIPLMVMPSWMQALSNISPVKWGIYALEGSIWRDFSTAEMLLPCGILLAFGAAFFAAGLAMYRVRIARG